MQILTPPHTHAHTEGQPTLCRWCPVSQRSSIHMQVITQPNPLHRDLAERWRSAANWLTFTGKSPTCTHNPATDGAEFLLRESRKDVTTDFFQQPCVCLQTWGRDVRRWQMITVRPIGSASFSGPPRSFELLAVKVFQVIRWWQGGLTMRENIGANSAFWM